jgi:hypothetical protein
MTETSHDEVPHSPPDGCCAPTWRPQAHPRARLKPRRAAPLVRQTAVSYDGGIVVACHEDGSLTR